MDQKFASTIVSLSLNIDSIASMNCHNLFSQILPLIKKGFRNQVRVLIKESMEVDFGDPKSVVISEMAKVMRNIKPSVCFINKTLN